jgi:hypothetical protein
MGLVTTTRGSCSQTWPRAVQRLHRRALAHEGPQFGHFREHHRDHFECVDFLFGKLARLF